MCLEQHTLCVDVLIKATEHAVISASSDLNLYC